MSYVRPVRKEELIDFLFENDHLDEHDLAEALIARFDIITTSTSPV